MKHVRPLTPTERELAAALVRAMREARDTARFDAASRFKSALVALLTPEAQLA